jgi:hypothetical protein
LARITKAASDARGGATSGMQKQRYGISLGSVYFPTQELKSPVSHCIT